MASLLTRLVAALVHIFYRRVEVEGAAPAGGPLLLVANHVNGLVDPMLVLAILPRRVVFAAKSTLWRVPGLRLVLDALGVVPVVRRVDVESEGETDASARNAASLSRLAAELRRGGAVLIFPEGRSHSEPGLSPMRTGAARVVVQAGVDVAVVPLGIWFTRKEEFRSDVLLRFGAPVVPSDRSSVDAWTDAIGDGLASVTLNAARWEEHETVRAVEAIYGEKLPEGEEAPSSALARSFRNRQLLLAVRHVLEGIEPRAVRNLARRARAFQRLLARSGIGIHELDDPPRARPRELLSWVAETVLGLPFALVGVVAWGLPYHATGPLALWMLGGRRNELDQLALYKILAGLVTYSITFALELMLVTDLAGRLAAAAAAVTLPLCGLFAVRYLEAAPEEARPIRALLTTALAVRREGLATLRRERDALRDECERLAGVYAAAVAGVEAP